MNIALLHYSVPPIVGGVESVIAHHARLMSADGHSVRLIAGRGESMNEQIPFILMPHADSRHDRMAFHIKEQLDTGDVRQDGQGSNLLCSRGRTSRRTEWCDSIASQSWIYGDTSVGV